MVPRGREALFVDALQHDTSVVPAAQWVVGSHVEDVLRT